MKFICYIEDYDCIFNKDRFCIKESECKYKKEIIDGLIGYEECDICNRNGCTGIIREREKEPCYCHTGNPPCSACTEPRAYCDECGWDDKEEQIENENKRRREREEARKFYDSVPRRISKLLGYRRDYL
jgi:hypothetical protein